jgi:hypothetical protein
LLGTVVLVLLAFGVLENSLGAGVNPLRAAIGFTGRAASVPARGQYRKTVPYRPKKLPIPVPSREECRQRQVISCRHQALTCARGGRVVGFCAHQTMQVSEKKRAPAPGSPPPPVDPCCSAEVASPPWVQMDLLAGCAHVPWRAYCSYQYHFFTALLFDIPLARIWTNRARNMVWSGQNPSACLA